MKYTKNSIQKVYALDIVDVARALGIEVKTGTGVYRMCHCFYPGHEDSNPSMWLNTKRQNWECPVCMKKGNKITLAMEKLGCEWIKAIEWLAANFDIVLDKEDKGAYSKPMGQKKEAKKVRDRSKLGASEHWNFLQKNSRERTPVLTSTVTSSEEALNVLDSSLLQRCFSVDTPFCRALVSNHILTTGQMRKAALDYHLGATRDHGVIFWQVDGEGWVRDGKIMFYQADCHRDHKRHPSWVSSRLHKLSLIPDDWSASHCLFGSHLVRKGCQVAIVESEKTAIICSALFPDFVWLATGGLSNLNAKVISALPYAVDVVLFPDTDPRGETYLKWREAIDGVVGHRVWVSRALEDRATPEQKARKIDIADLLIETNPNFNT